MLGKATVGGLLKMLSENVEMKANAELASRGVTASQIKTLIILDVSENQDLTLKELEKIFAVSQSTIAGIVIRLENKGLVEGYMDSLDKRVKHVRLTSEGAEICDLTKNILEESEDWILTPLNEEEQEQLLCLLAKMRDFVKSERMDKVDKEEIKIDKLLSNERR